MFRHHATSAVEISYAVDRVPASPRHVCGTPTTVSLKVPLAHWPCHRPTRSVMRSVSDDCWVGVVEGVLIESDMCELQGRGWRRVGRAMSIVVYNCVIIDSEDDGSAWWWDPRLQLVADLYASRKKQVLSKFKLVWRKFSFCNNTHSDI